MNNKLLLTTLVRRDSIENWERVNPILEDGELALVKSENDRAIIIGDGETPYEGLTKVHLGDTELYLHEIEGKGKRNRFVITLGGKDND